MATLVFIQLLFEMFMLSYLLLNALLVPVGMLYVTVYFSSDLSAIFGVSSCKSTVVNVKGRQPLSKTATAGIFLLGIHHCVNLTCR